MNKKTGILFFNPFWLTGGVERVTAILANSLCETFDVHVLVRDKPASDQFPIRSEVSFSSLSGSRSWLNKVMLYIQKHDIQLVIGSSGLIYACLTLYDELGKSEIPFIACNHENYFYPITREDAHFGIDRLNHLKKASAATFLTAFSEKSYRCFLPNGICMPNPSPFPVIQAASLRPLPGKNVIAVGRWNDPNKRLDRILRAFHLIRNQAPEAKLTIVGEVDLDAKIPQSGDISLNQLINRLALPADSIHFTGMCDVSEHYSNADINLLASESEGFGMVLIEAASFGIPSVICRVHGLEDVIENGVNGYVVAQDDVDEMAAHVISLFQSPELFQAMRLQTLVMAERYKAEILAERWRTLINTLLSPAPDLSPFQSPMHFTSDETVYIAYQLQKGLVESSRSTIELKTLLNKVRQSFPMRLFQPLFDLLEKIRKIWRKRR